jgi:methylenetetrahydrofolate reductase (NADPH)
MATWMELCEATLAVKRAGFTPVPHIAARRLRNEKEAQVLFSRLRDECAIESVFLIGGDAAQPAGDFYSSQDLMRTGILLAFNIRRVGFAGYPEGHPIISHSVLKTTLADKLGYLQENELEGFVLSQFCFDSTAIISWIKQLRASGIRTPIRVGLAGPTNALKLMRLAIRCGVGNSLRALRGRVQNMARLTAHHGADDVANELALALENAPELREVSVHVFAFGGVKAAFQWREKLSGDVLNHPVHLRGIASE